jgi:hypothetical protein
VDVGRVIALTRFVRIIGVGLILMSRLASLGRALNDYDGYTS